MTLPVPRSQRIAVRDGILVVAIMLLVALYVASIGPYWNISPDSATYVGWARALVAGVPYERGPVQPPVASLLFAGVLSVFPRGYTALNASSVVLVLFSLIFVYALVAQRAGRTIGLLVVLLSLASTRLYHESTQLLSEPAYMFCSMAALWLMEQNLPDDVTVGAGKRPSMAPLALALAGVMLLATVLTRTIGLGMVLAVLLVEGLEFARRRESVRWPLAGFAVLSIVAVGLWEVFGSRGSYATGWFRMFLVEDVWSRGSATLTLPGVIERVSEHAGQLPAAGRMLLNSWVPPGTLLGLLLPVAGLLLVLAGLYQSLRRRVTVTALYVLLYVGVCVVHSLGGGGDSYRLLVPVLPLIIYFALEAARTSVTGVGRQIPRRAMMALGVVYVVLYGAVGMKVIRGGVRAAHGSPFGDYPIKRPSNFDAQRLAMWIRDHSRLDDTFASWQRDMFEVIAERRGHALSAGVIAPSGSFVAWLGDRRIRYLLVDHRSGSIGDSLRSAIRQQPQAFRLVSSLHDASLYEVERRSQ